MTRPRHPARGAALPFAVAAAFAVAIVASELSTGGRLALQAATARRRAATALAAADTCLARVVHDLGIGWSFDAAFTGADGTAGTADDGRLAAPPGCGATLAPAPGPIPPARAILSITASVPHAQRRLEAVVRPATSPGPPALLWASDITTLAPVSGLLELDGVDHSDPGRRPLALLAAPAPPEGLDGWVAELGPRLLVAPGTLAPLTQAPPPLEELLARTRDLVTPGTTGLVPTGPAPLAVTFMETDLRLDIPAVGRGLLVVDGVLDVTTGLDFSGLVVARGLHVNAGASCAIQGALWLGTPSGSSGLDIPGQLRISRDDAALADADGLLPLPRMAIVAGVLDAS